MIKTLVFVALGGAVGASARYVLGVMATHIAPGPFPWGTFTVNITGSILLGVLAGLMTFTWSPSPELRAFLIVGVLGGFTTFSAFSMEVALFIERDRLGFAALYLGATVVISVAGLFAGLKLTRMMLT
jgi:fluoride exporter